MVLVKLKSRRGRAVLRKSPQPVGEGLSPGCGPAKLQTLLWLIFRKGKNLHFPLSPLPWSLGLHFSILDLKKLSAGPVCQNKSELAFFWLKCLLGGVFFFKSQCGAYDKQASSLIQGIFWSRVVPDKNTVVEPFWGFWMQVVLWSLWTFSACTSVKQLHSIYKWDI